MARLKPEANYFPKTRAKTAWGLMKAVNRVLLSEPQRLYMGNWISSFQNREQSYQEESLAPRCGSVGCYAGWVAMLHFGREVFGVQSNVLALLVGDNSPGTYQLRMQLTEAFLNTTVLDPQGNLLRRGTKPYARAIVARFERIMEEHKTFLKARHV